MITDENAYAAALKLARGSYQRAVLAGREAVSGATLRGKAAQYSARYAASRAALFGRLAQAGIEHEVVTTAHGKLVLVIGPTPPEMAEFSANYGRVTQARRDAAAQAHAERMAASDWAAAVACAAVAGDPTAAALGFIAACSRGDDPSLDVLGDWLETRGIDRRYAGHVAYNGRLNIGRLNIVE